MKNKNEISILGIDMDLGASTFGTRLGPEAIRLTGLLNGLKFLDKKVNDFGDIGIKNGYIKEKNSSNMTNIDKLYEALEKINKKADDIFINDSFPLILGGDHSLVLPTFKAFMKNNKNPGLIYIDAHADINTDKSSLTGNVHGMPVAGLMGLCNDKFNNIGGSYRLDPKNIVYVAIRDIDKGEEKIINDLGIKYYPMSYIDNYGTKELVVNLMDYLLSTDSIYLSFDIDSMDCDIAPGTGVPVRGGLSYNKAREILSFLGKEEKIKGFEFVEVNPLFDLENKTSKIARDLILAFFGKKFI